MIRRTPFAFALAVAGSVLVLAACASPGASGDPPMTPSTSLSVAPSETPTTEPVTADIPTDCAQIGSPATRASTVDSMTLQGDGVGFVRPAPPGATLVLGCDWMEGDATGVLILISETDAASADAFLATLPDLGYTCAAGMDDGDTCTMTTPLSTYPVDAVETIVSRGEVWIYMLATNVDGTDLLSELRTSIWES